MATIIEKLKQLLQRRKQFAEQNTMSKSADVTAPQSGPGDKVLLTEAEVASLLQQIENTHEQMYSCEESFALLDEYTELINSGEEAARLMPLVKAHLDACPDCHEAHAILLQILQSEADDN